MSPAELQRICVEAAEAGAQVLRDLYERPREVFLKGRIDLVTDADRASEARVLEVLRERAPGAAVLAEESGDHAGSEVRFIVDPLDGTTNYAHGIPIFCCTVGAEVRGEPVAGAVVDPLRGETFCAARGLGASLRRAGQEAPLRCSQTAELAQAVVCTGFPYERRERLPEMTGSFARFTGLCRGTRRLGSAAIDLAWVAAGRLDGFWEIGLKPWDVAAGVVLVAEAGGKVTRFDGAPHALAGGEILASGARLHRRMLEVLASPEAG